MKKLFLVSSAFLFFASILLANPGTALASEGNDGHGLEAEVHGYHVTLASQNEWVKGASTILVTLTDEMGMPVSNADVEILIMPQLGSHEESQADAHGAELEHSSMPGMEMEEPEPSEPAVHEEKGTEPITMTESQEHGTYIADIHLESTGKHEVHVFFQVNGEVLQADFAVEISGIPSRTIVLWSFALVNVGLVTFAGILRRQSVPVKGIQ